MRKRSAKNTSIDEKRVEAIANSVDKIEVARVLELIGDSGIFQVRMLVCILFISFGLGIIVYLNPYTIGENNYYCMSSEGVLKKCSFKLACEGSSFFVNYSDRKTMKMKYNLQCEREYISSFMQFSIFVVSACCGLISGFLADRVGRRNIILMLLLVTLSIGCVSLFVTNIWMDTLVIMVLLSFADTYFSVGQVLISEKMSQSFRGLTTSYSFTVFGLGVFGIVIFGYFLKEYQQFFFVSFLNLVLTILAFVYIRESQFYYFQRKFLVSFYREVCYICDENITPSAGKQIKS